MRFLCDRSLGRHKIVHALRSRNVDAIALDDHMLENSYNEEGDDAWLPSVGGPDWIVLTKDGKMRGRRPELDAIVAYKIGVFAIAAGNHTAEQLVEILRVAWNEIERISVSEPRPFYYVVWKDGTVHRRELQARE